MKGVVSPFTVAFYVAPLINAFIRSATFEERELLVRAFCEDESETFEYVKRGESFPTEENIYERVVRLMKSYKGKQDRTRDKALKVLMKQAESYKDDKVVIIDASGELDSAYTGLTAIKISESLNRPVLLVRKTSDGYAGSGRAFDYCPIEDFRALVEECPASTFSQGHPGAFGVGLSDIDASRNWFNDQLKDISFEKVYAVDFVVNSSDVKISWCQELNNYKNIFAHGVDEPLWAVTNINISNRNAKIVGKNNDTVQIHDDETGIKYVMFKCDESNEVFNWLNDNWNDEETTINIIGTLGINDYQGVYTPQITIKESEIANELD
jgi:single-stranded-DNA-specific exonuclease